jgi:hypothetical protein
MERSLAGYSQFARPSLDFVFPPFRPQPERKKNKIEGVEDSGVASSFSVIAPSEQARWSRRDIAAGPSPGSPPPTTGRARRTSELDLADGLAPWSYNQPHQPPADQRSGKAKVAAEAGK